MPAVAPRPIAADTGALPKKGNDGVIHGVDQSDALAHGMHQLNPCSRFF